MSKTNTGCKDCLYHHTCSLEEQYLCMYFIATKERRNSHKKRPQDRCDKYVKATFWEHKRFWQMINNMDNNPNKPNAYTLNVYRYIKEMKESKNENNRNN